jgi:hypothetical protein
MELKWSGLLVTGEVANLFATENWKLGQVFQHPVYDLHTMEWVLLGTKPVGYIYIASWKQSFVSFHEAMALLGRFALSV